MNSSASEQALKVMRNPFRGSIVGDPWQVSDTDVNVDSIHEDVFRTCCDAVEHVRNGSQCSAGITIHGAAGSGKTHLIGRLRRRLMDLFPEPTLERPSQAFAYIRLNTNSSSLFRHVRRCIADDLLRSSGRGLCQFERMVLARFMNVAGGEGHLESWHEYLLEERRDELLDLIQELGERARLSPNFVFVLRQLLLRQHRLDVALWLRGDSLSEKSYNRLEIAADGPDQDPEDVAKQVVIDFMRLAGPQVPLVLCFDQVEALQTATDDTQSLFDYGQLICELHDAEKNVVLISCMQSTFYDQIKKFVPDRAQARMSCYAAKSLNPLNGDEAIQLLVQRLSAPGFAEERPADRSELWPFAESQVRQHVGKGCTPRKLLDEFGRLFDELTGKATTKPKDLEQWLGDEWERRNEFATQQNSPEQSAEILRNGLPHLVRIVEPEWKVAATKDRISLDYFLTAPQREAEIGVKFCEDDAGKLANQLKTLDKLFPNQMNLHKLVLVRDERRPISKNAVKTLQFLRSLETKDAVFFRVPPEALAALDALRLLLADAQSGDLDLDGNTIEATTVIDWLRRNLPSVLKEMADHFVTQQQPDQTSMYVDQLQEYLAEKCIVSATDAAEVLRISTEELLATAASRLDLFGLVPGEPAVLFSCRLGSRAMNACH